MVTKAKKALLASLAAFLCVMLTVFGFSMSVSLSEKAKAADGTYGVDLTDYVVVGGIAGFKEKKFASFEEAYNAIKPTIEKLGGLVEEPASATDFDAIFTDRDKNGNAKLTYTIKGNVVYDETGLDHLLTMGRHASHYGNDRHLIKFAFVGVTADKKDTLTVNSDITLPYEWWGEKVATSISFENLTITGSAPNGLYTYQKFFEGIDFTVNNCTLNGIKIYNCANVGGSYTITSSVLDGTGAAANAYAIHLQGNDTAPLTINISDNKISGYDRGVNIDQATANATISKNAISVNDTKRSCIQLTRLAETTIANNDLNLTGGNAITLHSNLAEGSKITVQANTIAGNGYLIYDDTQKAIDLTYGANTVAATVDMTKGIYGGTTKDLSGSVYNEVHHVLAEVNGVKYETLQAAIDAAKDGDTVTLLADATEDVVVKKNITLDLGGKTLTGTNSGYATLSIQNGATTTVKNGSIVGSTSYYTIEITKGSNATATFEDLTATAGNTGSSMIDNWGTLTITSGTYFGGLNVVKSEEGSTLVINGGKFTLNYSTNGYTGVILVYGDTTINGGEFIQSLTSCGRWDHPQVIATGVVEGYTATTKVTGGSFTNLCSGEGIFRGVGKGTSDNFKVSGGTFNKAISADYCVDGFIPTKNADGTYGVKEGKYVAKVGSKNYETLADAIRLATNGKTVTLLDNINGNFEISDIKKITLDLNGFTLNGGTGTAKAAITNKGTLTITDSSAKKNGTIKRDDNGVDGETSYYVIENHGTMTIEKAIVINNSGYKKQNSSGSMVGSSLILNGGVDNISKLTIKGGEFTQMNFIAIKNDANGELHVEGGTITSNHSAVQNWFNAELTGGTIRGQLWTDAWKEGESVGNTVIGGNVDYEGEIVMDITGSIKPELTIKGGNLSVTNWRITTACAKLGGKPAVSGGTFSSEVNKDYLAKGYRLTKTGDSYSATEKYIASSTVSLGVDLSFKYEMVKGKSVNRVVASYYKVNETEATEYELTNVTIDGVVYYVFNGITPQMIDRKISVNVYVGNTVIYDVVEYSILDNLGAVLKKELGSKQDVTRQLVASLAYYGKAAMEYVKYDSSAVQKFIDDNKLTQLTAEIKDGVVAEYNSNETKVARISVQFADTNKVLVGVDEKVFDNYNYTIMVNGQEIKSIDWQTGVVSGYNVYVSEGFAARYITDASKYVEVEVLDKNNNNNRVQYVKYNVAGYCMMMKDNATMGALATATYYYGVAAANYAA